MARLSKKDGLHGETKLPPGNSVYYKCRICDWEGYAWECHEHALSHKWKWVKSRKDWSPTAKAGKKDRL